MALKSIESDPIDLFSQPEKKAAGLITVYFRGLFDDLR